MKHLLNLLAAIALLVWGTHLVRTGILRVFGANLRNVLAHSVANRWAAAISGLGVTALVQSSTATALIVSSFVGQGLVTLPLALAVMLGADVGTSLMAVVFSFDLSWLSPLFIFVGRGAVPHRASRNPVGRFGRILIGLGLMLLALRLVAASTEIMTQSPAVKALLGSISSDLLLEITVGAFLSVVAYSSLAIVLLTATMAASGLVPLEPALGLVLGANLGSGLLAVLTTAKSAIEVRQVPLGNFVFKAHRRARSPRRWWRCGCARCGPTCTTRPPWWCCSTCASTSWWRCCSSASRRWWRAGSTTGCPSPTRRWWPAGRTTSIPRRWRRPRWRSPARRARRCTRPTWSRP